MIDFLIWFIACLLSTFGVAYLYYALSNANKKINFFIFLLFIIGVLFLATLKYYNLMFVSSASYFLYFPFLFYAINSITPSKLFFIYL